MDLKLKYPPVPEHAAAHAQLCVDAARRISKMVLDYSVDSLRAVDIQLSKFADEGLTSDEIGETLFSFGCYVGEVLVRNLRGQWVHTDESPMAKLTPWPIVVAMPNGDCWNPIGKVFKRVDEGETESVTYMYKVAAQGAERPRSRR